MQFCTIENHQMAYEYHINENVILSWYQLLIRLRTGATYLVSSEWFEKDMFQLDLCRLSTPLRLLFYSLHGVHCDLIQVKQHDRGLKMTKDECSLIVSNL